MSSRQLVEFVGQAMRELAPGFQRRLGEELKGVFGGGERPARAVTVSRSFTGYAPDVEQSVVLGVEVHFQDGFESHIVKIGSEDKVGPDWSGWKDCTQGRDMGSRILHAVRKFELPNGRCAVLYRDAYLLFGGYRDDKTVVDLETLSAGAVKENSPDPLSVERVIFQIYTDLERWFYYDARVKGEENREKARQFYEYRLTEDNGPPLNLLSRWSSPAGKGGPEPAALRRDAIWLLCGPETPEQLDKLAAVYLDPVDYLRWAMATGSLPATLVGRSHGDLHGRNILLAVERGEAEYPAVIDYGKMARDNVLAWDFVLLETGLKAGLLPQLYQDPEARERLLKDSPRRRHSQPAARDDRSDQARRADRLEFAFRFEKLLAEKTARIQGRDDALRLAPPEERAATGMPKIDRLLGILMRIRQEAALSLGFQRHRQYEWRDEYFFGLAVCGLLSLKWGWEPPLVECALISAGLAAAIRAGQQEILRQMAQEADSLQVPPSYRVLLFRAHRLWQQGKAREGLAVLDRHREHFRHAVPLEQERALLLSETGQYGEAQELVREFKEGCRVFGDHETLSRLGRAYKEAGDRAWADQYKEGDVSAGPAVRSPAWQNYQVAQAIYEEAFNLSNNYYPGVNAASLALLLHDPKKAEALARKVAGRCAREEPSKENAFWVYATEGETALVRGNYAGAFYFYQQALGAAAGRQPVQAAYNQLCRLWHVRERRPMARIIDLFRKRAPWLKPGPVGDGRRRKGKLKRGK